MKSKGNFSNVNGVQIESSDLKRDCYDDQIEIIEKSIVSCINQVAAENFFEILTKIVDLEAKIQVLRLYSNTKIKQESLLELPKEVKVFSCSTANKQQDMESKND